MNHEHDVLSRLVGYHDHIAAPPNHIADDLRRGRRRVRRNRTLLPGAAALAVVSVIAAATLLTGGRSADRPEPAGRPSLTTPLTTPLVAPESLLDVRELGFHVEPGPGFEETDDWGIERDHQWTHVAYGADDRGPDVAVYYQGISPPLPSTPTREAVTINGASGTYIEKIRPDQWSAYLAWEYAPNSWAVVSQRGDSAPPPGLRTKLVTVAEAVRSGGKTLRVPIRVGTVPATLPSVATADGVNVQYFNGGWTWWLSFSGDIHLWATSQTGMDCQGYDGSPYTENFTYRGHPGCLVGGERIGLGLGDANAFIDFVDSTPKPPIDDMKQVLADFTVASSDPATWFDLRTALGGK
jgi:hypothetical protein